MDKDTYFDEKKRENFQSILEDTLKQGAQRMLQLAIEAEVAEYIERFESSRSLDGKRLVTRNGYLPTRNIQTGLGDIEVKKPRIKDRRDGSEFASIILPAYIRRAPSVENLLPVLYLKGISTGDFSKALEALLGKEAKGLSANTICRLKKTWETEYKSWQKRDLSKKRYVYIWADGIYFNIRLEDGRPCLLVLIGVLEDGTKELLAIYDGHRESKLSWKEVLSQLKKQGLKDPPELAIGDGAMGFWAALEEEFPETKQQRCWVHKTANLLDKFPKNVQPSVKDKIYEMYKSPTKKEALKAYEEFFKLYEDKYSKACECLKKDNDQLFSFYDFPAEHWNHIRTTNVIESTFATIRHRTRKTKGCGTRIATLTMVFKLGLEAEKSWRRIRGYKALTKVISGAKFTDGMEQKKAA